MEEELKGADDVFQAHMMGLNTLKEIHDQSGVATRISCASDSRKLWLL